MKVYYAHCIALYGTKQEERDVNTLTQLGFDVVNPNTPASDAGAKAEGMDYFRRFAQECDAIAFRALPDGVIPSGVFKEIGWFAEVNKPIIELPSAILRRELSLDATRAYLKEVGKR